jgi:hypothetical protein
MAFTLSHYLQQAAEFEILAAAASDRATRTDYLELAERYRDMANLAGFSQMQTDEESVRLAERMVAGQPVFIRITWLGRRPSRTAPGRCEAKAMAHIRSSRKWNDVYRDTMATLHMLSLLNDRLLRCHGDMWNGKIKRHDPWFAAA